MSNQVDLTLLLRNLEARYLIEAWKIEDELRLNKAERELLLSGEMICLNKSGFSCTSIALKLNVSRMRVQNVLKDAGLEVFSASEKAHAVFKKVMELQTKGLTQSKIAKQLKTSPLTVKKIIRNSAIEV